MKNIILGLKIVITKISQMKKKPFRIKIAIRKISQMEEKKYS